MGTIADKFKKLIDGKKAIVTAILGKGQTVTMKDSLQTLAEGIDAIETGYTLQEKTVNITANGTTEVTYDDTANGLSTVTINTNVPIPTASFKTYHYDVPKTGISLTLAANKVGYLYIAHSTALHHHVLVKLNGTRIFENKGNSDVGVINYIASGYNIPNVTYNRSYGTGDTNSLKIFAIRIPKSTSARTITIDAPELYGSRWIDILYGQE